MDERVRSAISIVVIDDEEVMRSACRDILEDEGYHVETFASAEEGLERVRRDPPVIAIVDLMMPRLNGREVLRRIRASAPTVRTIVITGYATIETEAETRDIGAFGFLAKPFTPGELRRLVEKAVAAAVAAEG
jgi:DNA-binding NtrC family response regulator